MEQRERLTESLFLFSKRPKGCSCCKDLALTTTTKIAIAALMCTGNKHETGMRPVSMMLVCF